MCYQLYLAVLQHAVVSCMPPPPIPVAIDCANGYHVLTPAEAEDLEAGIRDLHRASRYDEGTDRIQAKEADWFAITNALERIEKAKVPLFARLATQALMREPTCKVVLGFNYRAPLDAVAEAMSAAGYDPLFLTGKMHREARTETIALFQKPNTTHRLLLGNLAVMEVGIDLDDTDGRFPRRAYASPNYLVMREHQFTRRFYRVNTRSAPSVTFVFGLCGKEELSILNALARKTRVLVETLMTQVAAGMRFPGQYTVKIEAPEAEGLYLPPAVDADEAAAAAAAAAPGRQEPVAAVPGRPANAPPPPPPPWLGDVAELDHDDATDVIQDVATALWGAPPPPPPPSADSEAVRQFVAAAANADGWVNPRVRTITGRRRAPAAHPHPPHQPRRIIRFARVPPDLPPDTAASGG